jgi:hypothetical protein
MRVVEKILVGFFIAVLVGLLGYSLIGTSGNVEEIKQRVPQEIGQRGWEIMRYEGYQFGSWAQHGGVCWYHVRNVDNHNIQYRVQVALWNGELQWYYGKPEQLSRVDVEMPLPVPDTSK